MIHWLRSPEVSYLSDQPHWPDEETAQIWKAFRESVLSEQLGKWEIQNWIINLSQEISIPTGGLGRIEISEETGQVSVTTPDFRHLFNIRHRLNQQYPSLCQVVFPPDQLNAKITRVGPGSAMWQG